MTSLYWNGTQIIPDTDKVNIIVTDIFAIVSPDHQ